MHTDIFTLTTTQGIKLLSLCEGCSNQAEDAIGSGIVLALQIECCSEEPCQGDSIYCQHQAD